MEDPRIKGYMLTGLTARVYTRSYMWRLSDPPRSELSDPPCSSLLLLTPPARAGHGRRGALPERAVRRRLRICGLPGLAASGSRRPGLLLRERRDSLCNAPVGLSAMYLSDACGPAAVDNNSAMHTRTTERTLRRMRGARAGSKPDVNPMNPMM